MLTEDDFDAEEMSYNRLLLAVDDDDDESSRKAFNYACTLARTLVTIGDRVGHGWRYEHFPIIVTRYHQITSRYIYLATRML